MMIKLSIFGDYHLRESLLYNLRRNGTQETKNQILTQWGIVIVQKEHSEPLRLNRTFNLVKTSLRLKSPGTIDRDQERVAYDGRLSSFVQRAIQF